MRTLVTLSLVALFTLSVSACSSDDGDDGGTSRAATVAGLTGSATQGAPLYDNKCAVCHGADGKGASGPNLVAAPKADLSVEAMAAAAINGKGTMPSFATLTNQELADIVAYVRGDLRSK